MKILQITPAYKPAYIYGGPTMSVAKLCEALIQQQLDLEVLTTTANGREELKVEQGKQINVDGVPVTYFRRLTKDHTHFSPSLLSGLKKKINKFNSENQKKQESQDKLIIHIHSWWNLVTIFSCLVAKHYHIPVILSPRGMLTTYTQHNRNSIFKSILHTLIGKSLLKFVHIIASSEQERQDVLEITTPKSVTIIPNLVNLPPYRIQKQILYPQNKTFKLIFLSRIEEKKGLDILFDALAGFDLPWTLSIGGEGNDNYVKNLKEKAEYLMISDKLNWLGHINNQDKFELMKNHDLLVLTSHNENFANVVIESLSVGTPVLVSSHVGLRSYIEANNLGFIAELNVDQIFQKLNEAYHHEDKRNKIRMEAPKMIANDFSEEVLIKKYISLYSTILN